MELIPVITLVFLGFSVSFNAFLLISIRQSKKKPRPTISAEDLLHDFTTRGNAIVKIQVIDPANLLLRSPKH